MLGGVALPRRWERQGEGRSLSALFLIGLGALGSCVSELLPQMCLTHTCLKSSLACQSLHIKVASPLLAPSWIHFSQIPLI